MAEQTCRVGDIDIAYETFGDPERPALLLVMGLATQMIAWHEDFCAELAGHGFHVIRFDNRDVGRSTAMRDLPVPTAAPARAARPRRPPATRSRTWPAMPSGCSTTSASSARTSSAPRWAA